MELDELDRLWERHPATLKAVADTDLAGAWRLTLTGLTHADICGLRWTEVELDEVIVTVRQGRVVVNSGGRRDQNPERDRRPLAHDEERMTGRAARHQRSHDETARGRASTPNQIFGVM